MAAKGMPVVDGKSSHGAALKNVWTRSLLVIVPSGGGCSSPTGSNRRFTVATVLTVSVGSPSGGSN
jgi:hypothetical protein